MNSPTKIAKQVLEKYNLSEPPAYFFEKIANSENIKYIFNDYPNDNWDGILAYNGNEKVISVNTSVGQRGRHNFTFAHELGHYYLKHTPDKNNKISCSSKDIYNPNISREIEANSFASAFLMPEDMFKIDLVGSPIDFGLINNLANYYMVSKHACCKRIASFTKENCVILTTDGHRIKDHMVSESAKKEWNFPKFIPKSTKAYQAIMSSKGQENFGETQALNWLLSDDNTSKIYECTHCYCRDKSVMAMTIIVW